MNIGRLTAFILAAFAALAAPSAHAIRTPIDTTPAAIAEAHVAAPSEAWLIEAVYPIGQADDGEFIDIAVLVEPETHTRVWCYVKSPLGLEIRAVVGYKKIVVGERTHYVASKARTYDPASGTWGEARDLEVRLPKTRVGVQVVAMDEAVSKRDWQNFRSAFKEIASTETGGKMIERLASRDVCTVNIRLHDPGATPGNWTAGRTAHIDSSYLRGVADEIAHLEFNVFVKEVPFLDPISKRWTIRFEGKSVLHVDGLNEKQQVAVTGNARFADVGEAHSIRAQNVIAAEWETAFNKEREKKGLPPLRPSDPWTSYPESKGGGGALISPYLPIVPEGWQEQRKSKHKPPFPRKYWPETTRKNFLK